MGNFSLSVRNRILSSLSPDDVGLVEPHLEALELPLRHPLQARNRPIKHAYFLEHGIASVVANGPPDQSIEVGIIGWEGLTGMQLAMGTDRSPHDTYMQVPGDGHRIVADSFCEILEKSRTLRECTLRYAHVFAIQGAGTALANGRAKIEERLARWLLMAQDRANNDELQITHEFLALMLGVHRPGVTVALNLLEGRGLIDTRRAVVIVLDRKGLLKCTNGFYGGPEKEYHRLFGEKRRTR
jgi:hypothetical protein